MIYQRRSGRDRAQSGRTASALTKPIRVLTVDDSALIRLTLNRYLSQFADIEVVGQGHNGRELLSLVETLDPDVVVSDVEMPEMNGLEALDRLMRSHPRPVIMLSNLTSEGAEVTLQALEIGAFDFVVKPQPGSTMAETVEVLVEKIRCAASSPTPGHQPGRRSLSAVEPIPSPMSSVAQATPAALPLLAGGDTLVVVACSTGGPSALTAFLAALPPDLSIGGVIVQHMPAGFTTILSERLDKIGSYRIVEAEPGAQIRRGQFLVAPGGHHLIFDDDGVAHLADSPPVNGVRPAADVTMKSLARTYGPQILAVVLTGMGKDGFAGVKAIHEKGGTILAQDRDSSVVYGMPRHVVEADLAETVGAPALLARFIGERVIRDRLSERSGCQVG